MCRCQCLCGYSIYCVKWKWSLLEEDHTFSHASRHPYIPRSQTGCKMAALWHLAGCGVPGPGGHSARQGRQSRRLHAGPAEQVDLQPDRNGSPPSHLADHSGRSAVLWWQSPHAICGAQTWRAPPTLTVCSLLWVVQLMTLSLVLPLNMACILMYIIICYEYNSIIASCLHIVRVFSVLRSAGRKCCSMGRHSICIFTRPMPESFLPHFSLLCAALTGWFQTIPCVLTQRYVHINCLACYIHTLVVVFVEQRLFINEVKSLSLFQNYTV